MNVKQLTEEEAIEFANSKKYESMNKIEIAKFQLQQECLCMPFEVFWKSVEFALGRPVFNLEFAFPERLLDELEKKKDKPSLHEIIEISNEVKFK